MVGIGSALLALGAWFGFVWWRRREIPRTPWFLRAVAACRRRRDPVALWAGWIVTEVGRQPWIVHGLLRTREAVTDGGRDLGSPSPRCSSSTPRLGTGAVLVLRAMSRRWRGEEDDEAEVPYGRAGRGVEMSKADLAAAILWVGATIYAVFGGADFGGGLWDLIAGGAERGERPRELIERSIAPVWEANHVWLIFILVVLWTAFPDGLRRDHVDAVRAARAGRGRDRPARRGLRLPQVDPPARSTGARSAPPSPSPRC